MQGKIAFRFKTEILFYITINVSLFIVLIIRH